MVEFFRVQVRVRSSANHLATELVALIMPFLAIHTQATTTAGFSIEQLA